MSMQEPITLRQFGKRLRNDYEGYVVVGITGHRDLLDSDKRTITTAVKEKLKKLADGKPILLVSGLAMGADQWVAACAKEISRTVLCVPLTMTSYDYIESGFKYKKKDEPTGQTVVGYFEPERTFFEESITSANTVQVKLYKDSLYADGETRLSEQQRDLQYEELGKFMTHHCHHLLALWDGVDGGGVGGTSDVVRMMVQGKSLMGGEIKHKNTPQHIHQFVVPREKSKFPIGRRFAKEQLNWPTALPYTWVNSRLDNRKRGQPHKNSWTELPIWYWVMAGMMSILCLIDFYKVPNIEQDSITWGILFLIYACAGLAYVRLSPARDLLLQFIYPLIIAFAVLGLGTYGYYKTNQANSVDSFFFAANLITLNTSVFSAMSNPISMNAWLKTARILGGFLAGYAFILAFALATGRENVGRFLFFLQRKLRYLRRLFTGFGLLFPQDQSSNPKRSWWHRLGTFGVVLGNGTMAINVAIDAAKNAHQRVVLLANNVDDTTLSLLNNNRVWVFQGTITSRTALQKTFFWKANAVYVISDSDEDNFRCAQELDELYVLKYRPSRLRTWLLADWCQPLFNFLPKNWQVTIRTAKKPYWHVHQQNGRQRDLLQRISRQYLRTFSITENTARRLLLRYPIDRFQPGESSIAEVAILGFGQLGQDIALTCLRLGHYTPEKHLNMTVYYHPDEKDAVKTFRKGHPELCSNTASTGLFNELSVERKVQLYTLLDQKLRSVNFIELPTAENELVNPAFSLYDTIQSGRVVSIYVCLPTGLASASLLGTILPRIEWLKLGQPNGQKQVDVQAFCFYNFPDPDEEQYVEMKLNSIASYMPVVCFGNFLHECSVTAIQNESLSQIARQIALLYVCLYGGKSLDELPALKALLNRLGFNDKTKWSSVYNEASIEKTKVLLPELLAMKINKPKDFLNWLEVCWQNLKEIERESNSQAADHAWVKLRLLNMPWDDTSTDEFLPDDRLKLLSEVEHRRWNAEKLLLGWLPESNPDPDFWEKHKNPLRDQKLHHFLMTFEQLPPKEQNKDYTQVLGLPFFFSHLKTS